MAAVRSNGQNTIAFARSISRWCGQGLLLSATATSAAGVQLAYYLPIDASDYPLPASFFVYTMLGASTIIVADFYTLKKTALISLALIALAELTLFCPAAGIN